MVMKMNNSRNDKFNTIMPETEANIICIQVDKPISEQGYKENFILKIQNILEDYDTFKILVYYKEFKGWEENAAQLDMAAFVDFGSRLEKLALVNPPHKEILSRKLMKPMVGGDIQIFKENDLKLALSWIKK